MLAKGSRLREILKQPPGKPYSTMQQVGLVYLGTRMEEILEIGLESMSRVKERVLLAMSKDDTRSEVSLTSIQDALRTKLRECMYA